MNYDALKQQQLAQWMRQNPQSTRAAINELSIEAIAAYIEHGATRSLRKKILALVDAQREYTLEADALEAKLDELARAQAIRLWEERTAD